MVSLYQLYICGDDWGMVDGIVIPALFRDDLHDSNHFFNQILRMTFLPFVPCSVLMIAYLRVYVA